MKLHLDENFDNVQVEVQAVADPVFVAANEEHDENKEKYEAAMEANEEATEGLTPEEGESIEVEKREVLKQMHLEESLFVEEVEDKIQLTDEQKNRAYDELDMAEIVDNDIDENGNHFYDEAELKALDWFLVKRTEGDVEDYPYTLMVGENAWDDVTKYGFEAIVGKLEEDFSKGDKFKNQNDATIKIVGADDDLVVYKVASKDDPIGDIHSTDPKSMENVIGMNGYEKISESMEEIDRQVFGSLNKETREPGVYYVLVDQNFDHKIYADSDEEAIEKFRAQLNESLDVDAALSSEPEFYIDGGEIIDGKSEGQLAVAYVIDDGSVVIRKNLSRELTDEEKNKILNFVRDNYAEDAEILDESIADKYNTNQSKDINVDNIDIYIRKLLGDKNLNGLTKADREHIASYLAELRDEIKSSKAIDESLETSDFEERKENARLMHEVMMAMNNENAYFDWIYTMPDEPNEDDFEWFAEEDDEYKDLVETFNRIYKRYIKGGLYQPSEEVIDFLKKNGLEFNIVESMKEEYDPDLGGDTEDYKLDVEEIKRALQGLQFGTLRAEGLVDEFIETLEDWMPLDENLDKDNLNESESFPLKDSDKLDVREAIINTLLDAETTKVEALEILAGATEEVQNIDEDVFLYPSDERYEEVYESLIYNVAKEQLQRFNEGKMGDNWDPKTYLERLESKKYLNEEQIKRLTESIAHEDLSSWLDNHYGEEGWKDKFNKYIERLNNSAYRITSKDIEKAVKNLCKAKKLDYNKVSNGLNIALEENFHVIDLEGGESFGNYDDVEDAKAKAVQYTSSFNTKAVVVDNDNNVVDGFDKDGNSLK